MRNVSRVEGMRLSLWCRRPSRRFGRFDQGTMVAQFLEAVILRGTRLLGPGGD
jgi:hypothetical protein